MKYERGGFSVSFVLSDAFDTRDIVFPRQKKNVTNISKERKERKKKREKENVHGHLF